jgi:hypothetical protein
VGAALRNYGRPVFVRENPLIFSALIFMVASAFEYHLAMREVHARGFHAWFQHSSMFFFSWFMLTFMLPGCCSRQYWRQITTGIAGIIPGLIAAEYTAILLVLALMLVVLSAPFWGLGAPAIGAMALAAIGIVAGGSMGMAAPTGQHRAVRALLGLSVIPALMLANQPRYLALVVFAPVWVSALILLGAVGVIVVGLRYFPAQALLQGDALETTLNQRAARAAGKQPSNGAFAWIGRVWRWQPGFLQSGPVVSNLTMRAGPIGSLIGQALFTGLMAGFYLVLFQIVGHSKSHFQHMLLGSLPQSLVFSMFVTTRWLLDRNDWPLLFMAGRYGGRVGFARAMFRAHRRNSLQVAASSAVVGLVLLLILTRTSLPRALISALVITGLMFGASYSTAIPLFWREFGGKAITLFFQFAGFLIATFTIESGLFFHGLKLFVFPIAFVVLLFGLVADRVAAQRLAQMDWPVATETEIV